jgi:hypothetical protein
MKRTEQIQHKILGCVTTSARWATAKVVDLVEIRQPTTQHRATCLFGNIPQPTRRGRATSFWERKIKGGNGEKKEKRENNFFSRNRFC